MLDTQYFEYGEKEIEYLKSKDPVLAKVIDEIGHIKRAVTPDLFTALIHSVVGQQISTKAQATIWNRMQTQFTAITAENIAAVPAGELQACGLTMRKTVYMKEIAGSVLEGSLNLDQLRTMTDEEVCRRLRQIKGIGVWTAEMLMTFSMQRRDILSWDDLAIQRGLRMLYHHRKITPDLFAKYKRRYSPYATVASLYLWAIAGGACAGFIDYAPKTSAQKKAAVKKKCRQAKIEKALGESIKD